MSADTPMAIAMPCSCPACQAALEVDPEHAGWRVRCPRCSETFLAKSDTPVPAGRTAFVPPVAAMQGGAISPPPRHSGIGSPPPAAAPGDARDIPSPAHPAPPPHPDAHNIFSPPAPDLPGAKICSGAKNSLIFGILSVACLGWLGSIPAILMGIRARSRIRASAGALGGDSLALAGIVLGLIGLFMSAVDWDLLNPIRIFARQAKKTINTDR